MTFGCGGEGGSVKTDPDQIMLQPITLKQSGIMKYRNRPHYVMTCQQGACGGRGVCLKGPGDICGGLGDQYGVCGAGLVCSSCNRCEGTITFNFHESRHLFIRGLKCQQEAAAASIVSLIYIHMIVIFTQVYRVFVQEL